MDQPRPLFLPALGDRKVGARVVRGRCFLAQGRKHFRFVLPHRVTSDPGAWDPRRIGPLAAGPGDHTSDRKHRHRGAVRRQPPEVALRAECSHRFHLRDPGGGNRLTRNVCRARPFCLPDVYGDTDGAKGAGSLRYAACRRYYHLDRIAGAGEYRSSHRRPADHRCSASARVVWRHVAGSRAGCGRHPREYCLSVRERPAAGPHQGTNAWPEGRTAHVARPDTHYGAPRETRSFHNPTGATTVRVVIAGGGTAGHVNPALAVAGALGSDVVFLGTRRGSEARLVPAAGWPLETLEVRGFDRSRA